MSLSHFHHKRLLHIVGLAALFGLAACCFFACHTAPQKNSHPEYFDRILVMADSINSEDPDQTIAFIDSAYSAFPDPGVVDLFKKYSLKSHVYNFYHHQYATAKVYADSMLAVLQPHSAEPEFTVYYVRALLAKGLILQREGNYSMALEYYHKARRSLEATTDTFWLSEATTLLGYIKYKQQRYADAVKFGITAYKEVLSCPDGHKKYTSLQGKLDNIGIYYTAANMLDSGQYYFTKALEYIKEKEDKIPAESYKRYMEMARAVIYGNQGDAYYKQGDTAMAEKLYTESIRINSRTGFDRRDAQATQTKLAHLYIDTRQLSKAGQMLTQIKAFLDTIPNADIRLKYYNLQMLYHAQAGHKDIAYDYLAPYQALKDSIANAQLPQMDMEKEYTLIKGHYDLVVLKQQTALKTLYLTVTLIVSVLAILIACLMWLSWHRSRRSNTLITRQNNDLQLTNRFLEDSQKDNTRMMKIVAHDLRNPINSTISITSILLEHDGLPPDAKEMLTLMQTSSQSSIDMIADLLNVNTGKADIKKEPEDIKQLLQYCVDAMSFKASEKQQRINLLADNVTLNISKDKMWRVLNNLIANAIKFSPPQSLIIVRLRREQERVRIEVQDHGIGIPPAMQQKIFELFTDAKRLGTEGEQSFGLGLSISRQIVEAHDGTLTVASEEGKGSIFTITLPLS